MTRGADRGRTFANRTTSQVSSGARHIPGDMGVQVNYHEIRAECRNLVNEIRLGLTDLEGGVDLHPRPDDRDLEVISKLRQMLLEVLESQLDPTPCDE